MKVVNGTEKDEEKNSWCNHQREYLIRESDGEQE